MNHDYIYDLQFNLTISTFSPVGLLSSNGLRMCVCVLVYSTWLASGKVRNELIIMWICQRSPHTRMHTLSHTHTHSLSLSHTHTLIPFEDREPTGLNVDTAFNFTHHSSVLGCFAVGIVCWCQLEQAHCWSCATSYSFTSMTSLFASLLVL